MNGENHTCVECIEGMACSDNAGETHDSESLATLTMGPGYWRASPESDKTYPCAPTASEDVAKVRREKRRLRASPYY